MLAKKYVYFGLSVVVFLATLFSILSSELSNGDLSDSMPLHWVVLFIFILLLPICNVAEIIINRDDWSKLYWIGLLVNSITIFFVMRFFAIELDFIKMFA